MWFKAGLMKLVDDSRNEFLEWYAQKIRDTIGTSLEAGAGGWWLVAGWWCWQTVAGGGLVALGDASAAHSLFLLVLPIPFDH
jgi:hypothetical protein